MCFTESSKSTVDKRPSAEEKGCPLDSGILPSMQPGVPASLFSSLDELPCHYYWEGEAEESSHTAYLKAV